MKYSHIIWDFNGTIFDDVQKCIDCANLLLAERNLQTIPDKDYYRSVFCFPIIDYYTKLGFDFKKEKFEDLAVKWMEIYNFDGDEKATAIPNAINVLKELKARSYKQIMLSATEINMLKRQMSSLDITKYFDEILGLDNIYAGSKTHLGTDWVEKNRPERLLYIGDTTHDFDTAMAMGAECILYSGGHMTKKDLQKCGCLVTDDLTDILKIAL